MLFEEKVPYVFSIFVAALGWFVAHAADRISASPFIEYARNQTSGERAGVLRERLELKNLSSGHTVRRIVVILRKPHERSDLKFSNARIEPTPPTWVGLHAPEVSSDATQFHILVLPPGGEVEVSVDLEGKDSPIFQAYSESETTSFRLERRGVVTWFARNEFCVLTLAFAAWFIAMLLLLYWRRGDVKAQQGRSAI